MVLINQPDGGIDYYIRKQVEENGTIVTKYKKLPYEGWETLDDNLFIPKEINGYIYYHFDTNRLISVFLEDVFLFPDNFVYHPNDLEEKKGTYTFDYKDEQGYGDSFIDRALRKLLPLSESKRKVGFDKNPKPNLVNILPAIRRTTNGFVLEYRYYERGISHNSTMLETAIRLSFTYFGALQEFLNQTIFYGLNDLADFDAVSSKAKAIFLEEYLFFINWELKNARGEKVLEVLYYTPIFLFKKTGVLLWDVLTKLADGFLTNHNLNTEDIALKLIQALYEHRKTVDIFLAQFLTRQTTTKEPILYALAKGMDGQNFKQFVSLIHKAWKESNYAQIDPEKNNSVTITEESPVLLDYRSDKSLGFHTDNATIEWEGKTNSVTVALTLKTGIYQTYQVKTADGFETRTKELTQKLNYNYHPFSLIVILNSANPSFLFKDDEQKDNRFTKLPAFVLYAREVKAFSDNFITAAEYTVDIVTTFTGVGNLLKVGRLAKIFNSGLTFIAKAKKVGQVAVGVIEVSSGVGNTLVKLTNNAESPLGRAITKYLFYLEMLSLGGELTVALRKSLRKSADDILVNHADELENLKTNAKNADEVKEIDDLVEHLDEVAEIKKQKNANGGKSPKFSIIKPKVKSYWISFLEKKGIKFEIGSAEAIKLLKKEEALGLHVTRLKNIERNEFEQVIYLYDNPSTSTFLEECYHALQQLEGLPKYMDPITIRGITYENVDAWEYLAKKRILDEAKYNNITYEEYIFIENQLQEVLEGTY